MAREAARTGNATLVTKRGQLITVIVPADADNLLDRVPATVPEYVASMREADEGVHAGRSDSLADMLSEMDEQADRWA